LQAHEVRLSLYSGCHFCCRYTNSSQNAVLHSLAIRCICTLAEAAGGAG